MQAWVNGRLLESPSEPAVSVLDQGFTLGDAAFEAVKVVDGLPYALTRHLDRLTRSARGLGLPAPDLGAVRDGVAEVLAAEPLRLGRLRITYTAGDAPPGMSRGGSPSLVVVASPMPQAAPSIAAVTVPWPRNERSPLAGLKTTSFAENVLALAHARRLQADEGIFANLAGNICEGSSTNVFYVVGGQVRTPSLASGCLGGITRQLVCEWYDVREIDEPIGALAAADEVFVTSTTRDVQPVHRLDGRVFRSGPVTADVARVWAANEAESIDP